MADPDEKGILRPDQKVRRFFSDSAWVEGKAIEQLMRVAALSGVDSVAAFPGMHPGQSSPGAAAVLGRRLYPRLAGPDLGSGTTVFLFGVSPERLSSSKAEAALAVLGTSWEGDASSRLESAGLPPDCGPAGLGTLEGASDFCELLRMDEIYSEGYMALMADCTWLLVHSGPGAAAQAWASVMRFSEQQGIEAGSGAAAAFMAAQGTASSRARINRWIVAERVARQLGTDFRVVCDVTSHAVTMEDGSFLHLKGAVKADGVVPVVGSPGSPRYLLVAGSAAREAFRSLPHMVAGRQEAVSEAADELVSSRLAERLARLVPIARYPGAQ